MYMTKNNGIPHQVHSKLSVATIKGTKNVVTVDRWSLQMPYQIALCTFMDYKNTCINYILHLYKIMVLKMKRNISKDVNSYYLTNLL